MINLQAIAKILLEREDLLKNITPRLLQRHLNEVDLSLRAQIQSIEEQKIALKKEREKLNSIKSKINEKSSDNTPSSYIYKLNFGHFERPNEVARAVTPNSFSKAHIAV